MLCCNACSDKMASFVCALPWEEEQKGDWGNAAASLQHQKNWLFPSLRVALPTHAPSGNLTCSHFVRNIHKHSQAPLSHEFWIPDQRVTALS